MPELLQRTSRVQETIFLPEKQYYRFWEKQTGSSFQTSQGVVTILNPGEFNPYNGPDFKQAVIRFNSGKIMQGDIEFHVKAEDWLCHGHTSDREFDKVILHVALCGRKESLKQLPRHIPLLLLGIIRGEHYSHQGCRGLNSLVSVEEFKAWMEYFALERWAYLKSYFTENNIKTRKRILQFMDIKSNRELVEEVTKYYFKIQSNNGATSRENDVLKYAAKLPWKMGRKRPASHPLKRLPLLLKIANNSADLLYKNPPLDLSAFQQWAADQKKVYPPGKDFLCEILGNILLPLDSEITGKDHFELWYELPVQSYAITKKLLVNLGMPVKITFGVQQGILCLNKQFCSSQNQYLCPLCQLHLRRNS